MKIELHDMSEVAVLQIFLEHGIQNLKISAMFDDLDISADTMRKLEKLNDYLLEMIRNV